MVWLSNGVNGRVGEGRGRPSGLCEYSATREALRELMEEERKTKGRVGPAYMLSRPAEFCISPLWPAAAPHLVALRVPHFCDHREVKVIFCDFSEVTIVASVVFDRSTRATVGLASVSAQSSSRSELSFDEVITDCM